MLELRAVLWLAAISFLAVAGIGGTAYRFLLEAGNKVLAERLFFLGLLAGGIIVFFFFTLRFRARRWIRELDKVVELARMRGELPEERLASLGIIGNSIQSLYREISEVSERRANRIRLLIALTDGLLRFVETPLLVAETTGRILSVSQQVQERFKESSFSPVGRLLNEVFPDLNFKSVLQEAIETHSAVELTLEKETLTFYPLLDRTNTPAYFIVLLGKKKIVSLPDSWVRKEDVRKLLSRDRGGFLQFLRDRFSRKS